MMKRCALIRHGAYEQLKNVPSALQPYPLTEAGEEEVRQQAREFASWLKANGAQLDPIIDSSTLLRAWQTAEIYRQELSEFFSEPAQINSYAGLCERSVGAVANLDLAEIERIIELDPRYSTPPENWKSMSTYKLPFDGAESLLDAGERVANHLRSWHQQAGNDIKLIVGHGASIRHAAYHLEIISLSDIKKLSMFYGHPVVFAFADDLSASGPIYGQWKQRQAQDVPD
ncbi:histidine phosphatase family protein [Marinomonas sp.]